MDHLNAKLIEDFKTNNNKNLNDFDIKRNTLRESIWASLVII
jgi:hypothetical protein